MHLALPLSKSNIASVESHRDKCRAIRVCARNVLFDVAVSLASGGASHKACLL